MLKRLGAGVPLLLLAIMGGGCATIGCVSKTVTPEGLSLAYLGHGPKEPGRVVLVVTDAFRDYGFNVEASIGHFLETPERQLWRVDLGTPAAVAFQQHLAAHFEAVDVLSAMPSTALGAEVKAVIRPSLSEGSGYAVSGIGGRTTRAAATFTVEVMDAKGRPIYSIAYDGSAGHHNEWEGTLTGGLYVDGGKAIENAVVPAVHDLVAYLTTGALPKPQTRPSKT